mmetsp:Transcript_119252/g.230050  ORF Transcript_119252/g.230050 Transcript_119252/m.230050 type:complete len:111 (+) Transcript_119252:202-534(+)
MGWPLHLCRLTTVSQQESKFICMSLSWQLAQTCQQECFCYMYRFYFAVWMASALVRIDHSISTREQIYVHESQLAAYSNLPAGVFCYIYRCYTNCCFVNALPRTARKQSA